MSMNKHTHLAYLCQEKDNEFCDLPPPNPKDLEASFKKSLFCILKHYPYGIAWIVPDTLENTECWVYIESKNELYFEKILGNIENLCDQKGIRRLIIRKTTNFIYQKVLQNNGCKVRKVLLRLERDNMQNTLNMCNQQGFHPVQNPTFSQLRDYFILETAMFDIDKMLYDTYWLSLFEKPYKKNPNRFWIAIVDGEIVGGNKILFYPWYKKSVTNVICGLCVQPRCQKRGIGTSLLMHSIKYSLENNNSIELLVNKQDSYILRWYRKYGFREVKYDWCKDI